MDYGFYNWVVKVKQYFPFSQKELLWLGISIVIMAFVVGFDDGAEEFALASYSSNMALSLIAVFVAVIIHEASHRIVAPLLGYKVEFKPFMFGLLGGLILAFMSYGKIIFLAYGSFFMDIMEKHRLGYFRHYWGYFDLGKVAIWGPVANLVAAMIFKSMVFLPEALVSKLVFVNALFAITNMLPIPPLDGAHIMYASRTFYPIALGSVVGAAALLLIPGVSWWMALLGSVVIAVIFTIFYFRILEGKVFGDWNKAHGR